jgi:hypothetical protein
MEVYSVSSYEEIKTITDKIRLNLDDAVLFRGDSDPRLIPSIAKRFYQDPLSEIVLKENLLFEEFMRYFHHKSIFEEKSAIDWEMRIAAREFGLASSLMDWTCNLDIAIEFAIDRFVEKNISYTSLWVLKKSSLKQIIINSGTKVGFNEISEPTIVNLAQYSETTHWHRKFIQGGYFLKQPHQNICISLDANPEFEPILVQIIIPQNAVGNIWKKIATKRDLDLPSMPVKGHSDKTLGQICDAINNKYCAQHKFQPDI